MKNSKINFMPISDHLATENTFVDNEIADAFKLLPVFSSARYSQAFGSQSPAHTLCYADLAYARGQKHSRLLRKVYQKLHPGVH